MQDHEDNYTNESLNSDKEMLPFSLSMIAKATNNFSPNNKLGEGGFGPVYKVIHYTTIYISLLCGKTVRITQMAYPILVESLGCA